MRERAWRRGRVLENKPDILGSRPGDVTFETIQFYRRSSTFVKVCRKSLIFIVKCSSGKSETFFDSCVNWSCVTRCGCRTTSSTLFTVDNLDLSGSGSRSDQDQNPDPKPVRIRIQICNLTQQCRWQLQAASCRYDTDIKCFGGWFAGAYGLVSAL